MWVKVADGDGCKGKWRKGIIVDEVEIVYTDKVIISFSSEFSLS